MVEVSKRFMKKSVHVLPLVETKNIFRFKKKNPNSLLVSLTFEQSDVHGCRIKCECTKT